MSNDALDDWLALFEEVDAGMRQWRREHPRSTLTEIERALDERWAKARSQIVSDVAGFLVNRLLGPYLDEALRLFEGGIDPLLETVGTHS